MTTLTQNVLKSLLAYDPETGLFTWLRGKRANSVINTISSAGYVVITINKRQYRAHRLAWLYMYGNWPNHEIDHINHIRHDNRILNLRNATSAQNHQNRRRLTNSRSGFLGVTWHKRDKRWQAYIDVDGRSIHLGHHLCLGKALLRRKNAEKLYHPHRPD